MRASLVLVLLVALFSPRAWGDLVRLRNGGRVEGRVVEEGPERVVVETKFGRQVFARSDVVSIERRETAEERLRRRAREADDADGVFAIAEEAGKAGLRRLRRSLLERTLELDPDHAGANAALGRVRFEGRWVSPEERERLMAEKRREELRRRGLVEYRGRFVTPEEKERLEQGFIKVDGEWLPEDEAMRRRGFQRRDGRWVPAADVWMDDTQRTVARAVDVALDRAVGDHVVVYGDVDPGYLSALAELLEKGYRRFADRFRTGDALEWLGGRRVDVFVFRLRFDYQDFVRWVGGKRGMGEAWGERAARVESVYRFDDAWAMAATYLANRGQKQTAGHCANMLGHILINRFRYEGDPLPPFFDEAFAALFEHDLLGRNVVFSRGSGRYERHLSDEDRRFFEDGDWLEAFREELRRRSDTPLEIAVGRGHGELTQMEVAKGMAVLDRWRELGEGRLRRFFEALRKYWPSGSPPLGDRRCRGAIVAAVRDVEGRELTELDVELRRWAMTRKKP